LAGYLTVFSSGKKADVTLWRKSQPALIGLLLEAGPGHALSVARLPRKGLLRGNVQLWSWPVKSKAENFNAFLFDDLRNVIRCVSPSPKSYPRPRSRDSLPLQLENKPGWDPRVRRYLPRERLPRCVNRLGMEKSRHFRNSATIADSGRAVLISRAA
jgi:hypothetical protein